MSKVTMFAGVAAVMVVAGAAMPARAAFHLWALNEVYTNNSGTLQFVELVDTFGSQTFVGGQQIQVLNVGGSQTHTFTLSAATLPGNSLNHKLLFGTAGLQAAGGPAPDYIIPDGFLFSAGGTINFFGLNSGAYTSLPTDGDLSRTWGGGNAVNSPTNYAGTTGHVVVPGPSAIAVLAGGGLLAVRRKRRTAVA